MGICLCLANQAPVWPRLNVQFSRIQFRRESRDEETVMDLKKGGTDKKSAEVNLRNRVTILAGKMDSSRVYRKMKLQQEFLEKSLASLMKSMKVDAEVFHEITGDERKSSSQRQLISDELMRGALKLIEELKSLKSMIQEPDPEKIKNLDLTDCKSRLTELSNQIENFRSNKCLDKLKEEEAVLESDLNELERVLIVERPMIVSAPKRVSDKRKFSGHIEPNDRFLDLVARTGHTEGWSEEDHSLFLRIRKKCNSVPQLVAELRERRSHLTNEEVINHEAWYKLYSELREKRKKVIAEWRRSRKTQGAEPRTDNREVISRTKNSSEEVSEERRRKRDEKKRLIDEWKAEKARKIAMDDEQNKRLEIARIDKEKKSREAARREARAKIWDYEERKKDGDSQVIAKKFHSETNLRSEVGRTYEKLIDSTRLIKSFREQDEKFIERRLKFLKVSGKFEQNGYLKPVKSEHLKTRTSSSTTLFSPTKVWKEKCKNDKNIENIFGRVNYVKDIKKLAPPRHNIHS